MVIRYAKVQVYEVLFILVPNSGPLKTPGGISLIIFFILSLTAAGQVNWLIKKDLKTEWLVHTENRFIPYNGSAVTTIYFTVQPARYRGDYLVLRSTSEFSIFLEGKLLLAEVTGARLEMDSVSRLTGTGKFMMAVHQWPAIKPDLITQVISETQVPVIHSDEIIPLQDDGLHNFFIAVLVMLMVYWLILFRYNPKLVSDCFSLSSFFSLRESDDHPMFNRIGNTTNVLVYIFAGLLVAAVVVNMPLEVNQATGQPMRISAWMNRWAITSMATLLLLLYKGVIIFVFSSLFNIRYLAGFHFVSFIRFVLFVFGILLMGTALQSFSTGSHFLNIPTMISAIHYLMLVWMVWLFLKLLYKVPHSAIHLFLYICATEIIHSLILIKVFK
jgi:hypothetical protein